MALIEMPAVSLHQPWASLIFAKQPGGHQVKKHETRNRPAPPKYVGRRIAIHAAKQPILVRTLQPALLELCLLHFGDDFAETLPFGAYVGTVVLAASERIAMLTRLPGLATPADSDDEVCGYWEDGRWAWRLEQAYRLATPVAAKGLQGWWTAKFQTQDPSASATPR
jgi:hypothetical protein